MTPKKIWMKRKKTITTIPIDHNNRDYYCSMKFRYFKIDLESKTTYTCHAASPHRIDFTWLQHHPGNLFNHDINVQERQMMLNNQRAPSCEQNCWHAEDRGQISPRLGQGGNNKTHSAIMVKPEMLDLTVGADCNLSCSYCCKEYSSSWRRELAEHGDYDLTGEHGDRYRLTDRDRVAMKISQPVLMKSPQYNLLLDEIQTISENLQRVDVTGGEPFLNNQLIDLLENLAIHPNGEINIYSGLGVEHSRFDRMIGRLSSNRQINIRVSGEGLSSHLEFNRYGVSWTQWTRNLQSIKTHGIPFKFHSTLTNLTGFGFADFVDFFHDHDIVLTFAYQPRMQALHVMDHDSKKFLMKQFSRLPKKYKDPLEKTLSVDATENEREDMAKFLKTYIQRRPDLDVTIYPKSFVDWLGIDHVV